MANEHTFRYEKEVPSKFTVADATAITKGALLKLTSPMTAIITSGNMDQIAGVAAADKVASDGVTSIPVYRWGILLAVASGSVTVGDALASAGGAAADVNKLYKAPVTASGSQTVGIALETVTTGQTFLYELNVGCNGNGAA